MQLLLPTPSCRPNARSPAASHRSGATARRRGNWGGVVPSSARRAATTGSWRRSGSETVEGVLGLGRARALRRGRRRLRCLYLVAASCLLRFRWWRALLVTAAAAADAAAPVPQIVRIIRRRDSGGCLRFHHVGGSRAAWSGTRLGAADRGSVCWAGLDACLCVQLVVLAPIGQRRPRRVIARRWSASPRSRGAALSSGHTGGGPMHERADGRGAAGGAFLEQGRGGRVAAPRARPEGRPPPERAMRGGRPVPACPAGPPNLAAGLALVSYEAALEIAGDRRFKCALKRRCSRPDLGGLTRG